MSRNEQVRVVCGAFALSMMVACGAAEDTIGGVEGSAMDGDHDELSSPEVASPSEESESTESAGTLLFEHQYSETGRFTIYEYEGGVLQAAVTGSAEDSPDLGATAIWGESFSETFRALSPDAELPNELQALDVRLQEFYDQTSDLNQNLLPPTLPDSSETIGKSYAWFVANVCKSFWTGGWRYVPWGCWYLGPTQNLSTSVGYNNHTWSAQKVDRVYALNDSQDTTNVWICKVAGPCSNSIQLNPNGGWGWMFWTVTPFTNSYYGRINTQTGVLGDMGITIHYATPDPG